MNWEQIEKEWDQVKVQVKNKWGDLTDEDIAGMNGKKDLLIEKLLEKYGFNKRRAEREIELFMSSYEGIIKA